MFGGHGHSHGGKPCHGHGQSNEAEQQMAQAQAHGHSHGGKPCSHGHGGHGGQVEMQQGFTLGGPGGLVPADPAAGDDGASGSSSSSNSSSSSSNGATAGPPEPLVVPPLSMRLLAAINSGHVGNCEAVLEGADAETDGSTHKIMNARSDGGHTLTHWAAQVGSVPVLAWLLDHEAPLSEQSDDRTGMHPLHWACTRGHVEVVHLLMQRGAELNCLDKSGCTPLLIASQYGHPLLVSYLMQRGADANKLDHEGDSALHWAAYKGNGELVALFTGMGLPLDAQDSFGQTPLHLAALRNNFAATEVLVEQAEERGIKEVLLKLPDKEGKTPIGLAQKKGNKRIEARLRTAASGWSLARPWDIYGHIAVGSRAPYYFVILQMILGAAAFPFCLLRCAAVTAAGRLLLLNVVATLSMYALGYLCTYSDPGTIKPNGPEHAKYLATTQSLAESGEVGAMSGKRLCHATQMELPLRAKYCKEIKACVLEFDHYCPFVHNAIGRNNYPFFFWYLIAHTITTATEGYFFLLYVRGCGGSVFGYGMVVNCFMMALFGGGLGSAHVWLTATWLTTNEQMNAHRYDYLKDGAGQFLNPFDKGLVTNCLERACNLRSGDSAAVGDETNLLSRVA